MSTTMSASAPTQGLRNHRWAASPTAILRRWWRAYLRRRVERAAASQLWSMSDRELKDIGLTRSQIMGVVTGVAAPDRTVRRYF